MALDGGSNSSPALTAGTEHTEMQNPDHKPPKLRRFLSLSSRRRKPSSKLQKHPEPADPPTPMTTLSPRPTDCEPCAQQRPKRSLSSFLLPRSSSLSRSRDAASRATRAAESQLVGQGHLPVTETPYVFPMPPRAVERVGEETVERGLELVSAPGEASRSVQMQPRKDSVVKSSHNLSASQSRTAALTSHPVGEVESEDEFQTPGEFWGRQKGGYVG